MIMNLNQFLHKHGQARLTLIIIVSIWEVNVEIVSVWQREVGWVMWVMFVWLMSPVSWYIMILIINLNIFILSWKMTFPPWLPAAVLRVHSVLSLSAWLDSETRANTWDFISWCLSDLLPVDIRNITNPIEEIPKPYRSRDFTETESVQILINIFCCLGAEPVPSTVSPHTEPAVHHGLLGVHEVRKEHEQVLRGLVVREV